MPEFVHDLFLVLGHTYGVLQRFLFCNYDVMDAFGVTFYEFVYLLLRL